MRIEIKKMMAIFSTCLVFFIFDRIIKNLYFLKKEIGFLSFYENPRIFYFFQGSFFNLFFILIFLGLIFLIVRSFQLKDYSKILGLTLIFIGGFSNFWDRLLYGFVIDYFVFLNLWVFNLADLMIYFGAMILIFRIIAPIKHDKI